MEWAFEMTKYNGIMNEVRKLESCRAVVMLKDLENLHKMKMDAFKSGEITEKQAIRLENRIDNII